MYDTLPLFLGLNNTPAAIVLTLLSWLMLPLALMDQMPVFCLGAVLVGWVSKRWMKQAAAEDFGLNGAPLDLAARWFSRRRQRAAH
jgi:hypothetical protein